MTQENWKENEDVMRENTLLLRRDSVQQLFTGYYFDITSQGPSIPPQKKQHTASTSSAAEGSA